ncbi:MAG: hypothetical protein ABW321_07430 [Polyangiales bacterium]
MRKRVGYWRTLRVGIAVGVVVGSGACGGDDDAPPITPPPTNRDSGQLPEPWDAAVQRPDAGTPYVPPGEPEPGLAGNCAVDSNKIYDVAERSTPFMSTPLAVDPISSGFALPYVASGACLDAVHWASLEGAAHGGEPESAVAIDACALVRDAVASPIGQHWLLASIDTRDANPYDIWVGTYSGKVMKPSSGQRISENTRVETGLALTTLRDSSAVLLAYADEDLQLGQSLHVQPLDSDGKPRGDAVTIESSDTLYYQSLTLRQLGQNGAALAYVRYTLDYTRSEIVFVALDADGKPLRDAWVLAGNAGPSASVDVSVDGEGGGIVYSRAEASIGRQVWFQQIDSNGEAALQRNGTSRAPALRIVNSPARGIDVSMTKLRTSFLVTYRALPTGNETRAKVRLYFLDRYGAVIGSSDVSYTSNAGGRTAIQSANDGRVVVSWNQVNDDGTSTIKVVRLPCVGG